MRGRSRWSIEEAVEDDVEDEEGGVGWRWRMEVPLSPSSLLLLASLLSLFRHPCPLSSCSSASSPLPFLLLVPPPPIRPAGAFPPPPAP
eukprot:582447-Pyramimonas_sp.AAC.1